MHRMLVCLITFVLLLAVATPLAAQELKSDVYVVAPGDSAWRIAGDMWENPTLWRKVVEKNPLLQQKGRITVNPTNGWTYVLMHPGEQLFGLQELGITAPTPTPLSELGIKTPDPVVVREIPVWGWWVLGLVLAALVAMYLIYRMLTRDPATAGPAMVPGGVTETNATAAMQQVAARTAGNPSTVAVRPDVYQQFTIIRQTAGRIWGNMTVRYADGRSVPRRLNGDRAYEAVVRFPDGHTETLYMLQGCGNDLRYGGISRYLPGPEFRFEADTVVVPTAAPTPTPAPSVQSEPAPVPAPAAQTAPAPEPAPAAQQTGISFEFKRASNGQPAMVRMRGIEAEEFNFSVGSEGTTLRFREVKEEVVAK